MKPTKKQIENRNREWAKDLRANKRKNTGCMLGKSGGRCCLMVAVDTAIRLGLETERPKVGGGSAFPNNDVVEFFGWGERNPKLFINEKVFRAASLNDGGVNVNNNGFSHKQIAELVENTFVHPSKPKLTLGQEKNVA